MPELFNDISIVVNQEQPAFVLSQETDKQFVLTNTPENDAIIVRLNPSAVGQVTLKGERGERGERGEDLEAADPGDLTLIFENKII